MKTNNIFILAVLLTVSLFSFSSCDKEEIITDDKLPTEISNYVATHFPNISILQSKIELDDFTKTYEVLLEGNFKLTFNKKKEIIEIEGVSKLPDSVIPAKIREYVTANYPTNFIVGWELDDNKQQIELDNDLDLEFTMNGDFIRIDS